MFFFVFLYLGHSATCSKRDSSIIFLLLKSIYDFEEYASFYPIILALIFVAGVGTVIIRYLSQARVENDALIADHIGQLKDIFRGLTKAVR